MCQYGGKPAKESIEIRALAVLLFTVPAMGIELPDPFFNRAVTGNCGQSIPRAYSAPKMPTPMRKALPGIMGSNTMPINRPGMMAKKRRVNSRRGSHCFQ